MPFFLSLKHAKEAKSDDSVDFLDLVIALSKEADFLVLSRAKHALNGEYLEYFQIIF